MAMQPSVIFTDISHQFNCMEIYSVSRGYAEEEDKTLYSATVHSFKGEQKRKRVFESRDIC